MTVSSLASSYEFAGNGVTTVFSFPAPVFQTSHLVVTSISAAGVETVQTLGFHYSVVLAGDFASATVTMVTAPATGTTLEIKRSMPIEQQRELGDTAYIDTDEWEKAFDEAALRDRELSDRVGDLETVADDLDAAAASATASADSATASAASAATATTKATDAAASAASAALVTGALPRVNLTALKALDTTQITVAWLTDDGNEGMFHWRTGSFTSRIDDVNYIKANAVADTAGAWVRKYLGLRISAGTGDSTTNNVLAGYKDNAIAGGDSNVVLGGGSSGSPNLLSGSANLRTIIGSYDSEIEASLASSIIHSPHSVIRAAATHAQISGGSQNEISNGDYDGIYAATLSVISSTGDSNVIMGGVSASITMGGNNLLTGYQNTITGGSVGGNFVAGYQNVGVQGNYGYVVGRDNTKTVDYTYVKGFQAVGHTVGGDTIAAGNISQDGDAQSSVHHRRRSSTDASIGYALGADNAQTIATYLGDNWAVAVDVIVVAHEKATGASKRWTIRGLVNCVAGVAAVVGTTSTVVDQESAGATAWATGMNTTGKNIRISGVGEAAKTIRWSYRVTLTEVETP